MEAMLSSEIFGATIKKILLPIFTVVRTSHPTYKIVQLNLTNSELAIIRTTVFFAHYDLDDHIAACSASINGGRYM
jgi:Ca2+/H+ antiporter